MKVINNHPKETRELDIGGLRIGCSYCKSGLELEGWNDLIPFKSYDCQFGFVCPVCETHCVVTSNELHQLCKLRKLNIEYGISEDTTQ